MSPSDRATTHDLTGAIERILPALERFLRFEGADPARARSRWRPALEGPLPQVGVGRDAVLAELADVIIANGLRVGHPGFSGWVTTGPTDVGAAADLAQAVAVPQRWWATAGNLADDLGVPLRSVLLAAHMRALATITNHDDVVTGLVTNGRPERNGGDRVLGLFLNTIPFRLRDRRAPFRDLVRETFRTEQQIAPHRRFPLAEMQKGTPLFETDFTFAARVARAPLK